jgi:hypothetical protein
LDPEIIFIKEGESYTEENVILLDSFNVVDLVNKGQRRRDEKRYTVVAPDFIYFSYEPWIKYRLLDYQSSILFNQIRESLDVDIETNKTRSSLLRNELIKTIRNDIKNYTLKYDVEFIESPVEEFETIEQEDIEFINEEEIDLNINIEHDHKHLLITTIEGEEINIQSNEFILLQRDSFIKAPAKLLIQGDLFLLNEDLNTLISDDRLYNKLAEIPESIKAYQYKLFKYPNVYQTLKNKGISYLDKRYFDTNYLLLLEHISDETLLIPRRKNDWLIICDLLSIDHNDMNLTFIAYYGRKKKNRIKEIYRSVIDLFLKNDYFGITDNPFVIKQIESVVDRFHDVFKQDEYYNPYEIAQSIVQTIMNELQFKEVSEIKILDHE